MDTISTLPSQERRVIVVTGANAGLGYETTLALAKKGARVVMACRSSSKARTAREALLKEAPNAELDILELDLSSLQSVRNMAAKFQASYDRLDVLINNAGVMMPPYTRTEDGFELQFMSNYLGHFLLTGLLLPSILKTPASRIVSLSSIIHKRGQINFEDLQSEKSYSAQNAYAQSKLACLLYAYELQRRLEKAGHTDTLSTAAHPGIATTELGRHMPRFLFALLTNTIGPFIAHSSREGAKPSLLAAIGEATGGDYFGPTGFRELKGKPGKASSSDLSKDAALAKRLWEVSEELVGLSYL
ncbi:NAD(P)-dependent dehydrogenase, short-chain alcohol dehydrogenase family [Cyclobacterium xiamenense]|uniref:NAD(P)-dependent dehydrogenase, short-chain alcohol dehydrogenase family n=1 Tax=Cyclobacterium xiamenense TaxID=1297121 RepID=A0A1H6U871_9BACT|nr:oxidoreductase [Cyclobacterium xiamenense]SEI88578.1 NAD(P)-dependent dehydrogenase, short-chain alcohol dehydrogenase family [Cyclobacterium xiamenense]